MGSALSEIVFHRARQASAPPALDPYFVLIACGSFNFRLWIGSKKMQLRAAPQKLWRMELPMGLLCWPGFLLAGESSSPPRDVAFLCFSYAWHEGFGSFVGGMGGNRSKQWLKDIERWCVLVKPLQPCAAYVWKHGFCSFFLGALQKMYSLKQLAICKGVGIAVGCNWVPSEAHIFPSTCLFGYACFSFKRAWANHCVHDGSLLPLVCRRIMFGSGGRHLT